MSSEGRRSFVLTVLATIGGLSVLCGVLFVLFFTYMLSSVGGIVKNASLASQSSFMGSGNAGGKVSFALPQDQTPYIAGVKLSGEINQQVADEVTEKLQAASDDSSAIGVLLEVNSPGGTVVPSQEIYDSLNELKKKKPVVVYVRDMAASGAYYSSASANQIIANRGSIVGSIGVIMNGFEANKLLDFLKITPTTIKTGALKDAGSPTRKMTDEDKHYLQSLIDATRAQFVEDVKKARHMNDESLMRLADGRVVLAPEALKLKLIDKIGTKQEALDAIALLAKQKKTPDIFYYENIQSLSDILSRKLSTGVREFVTETAHEFLTPRL